MAYTGCGVFDNDAAADLVAELRKKKNRAKLPKIVESRIEECLAILSGRKSRHYIDEGNVDGLIQIYGTFEIASERIGLTLDSKGYYIKENKALAADEAVVFAWMLVNQRLSLGGKARGMQDLIRDVPFDIAGKVLECLDIALRDNSVISEWMSYLGQEKVDSVSKSRETLANLLGQQR